MIVLRQHLPLVSADSVGKIVGIERRHRRHRQNVSVGHVENDNRFGLIADPPGGKFMKIGIDGKLDRLATDVGLGIENLDQPAFGRDFDLVLLAWNPGESAPGESVRPVRLAGAVRIYRTSL